MLHILHNSLLADGFLYLPLRLHIVWVCVQPLDLALLSHLRAIVPLARVPQKFCETRWVRLRGCCQFWLRLRRG
ncbi:hypothetical protein M413DRAFT_318133 [Hebeloma cylindrosporum]|uniref:Uncharacterized protein n=1 Tax=Hebeloma cylindrosporum TaxID=76867 RepID=A0A0C2Y9Q5_HEBCY|nr:hypothetical protein M413DRAFT_318133 [Hebeloma cylindrosporum h7]